MCLFVDVDVGVVIGCFLSNGVVVVMKRMDDDHDRI